jgi:lipopolysaccharide transport system permease protein
LLAGRSNIGLAKQQPQKIPLERLNSPSHNWQFIDFKELWNFRALLFLMAWRDVQVRYKQTLFGILWAVINPIVIMVVFTFVFNTIAQIDTYNVPYPIFSFSGLVVWNLFSRSVSISSTSIVGDGNLLSKVYFPRIISPLARLGSGLVDFTVAFVVLILMMLAWRVPIQPSIIFLPFFVFLALLTAAGIGFWFAGFHVRYRDIGQLVPFLLQVWMYISPIAYPTALVAEKWRTLYGLNPMVGVIDGFRWVLLPDYPIHMPALLLSTLMGIFLFVTGVFVFRRLEKTFVDYI